MAATRPHRAYPREVFGFVREKYANGLDPRTIKTRVGDVYGLDVPIGTIEDWAPGRSADQQRRYRKERRQHRREAAYERSFSRQGLNCRFSWLETGESYKVASKGKIYFYYLARLERLMPAAISVLGPLTRDDIHAEIKKATGVSFSGRVIPSALRALTSANVLKYDGQTKEYQVNPDSTYVRLALRNPRIKNLFKP